MRAGPPMPTMSCTSHTDVDVDSANQEACPHLLRLCNKYAIIGITCWRKSRGDEKQLINLEWPCAYIVPKLQFREPITVIKAQSLAKLAAQLDSLQY